MTLVGDALSGLDAATGATVLGDAGEVAAGVGVRDKAFEAGRSVLAGRLQRVEHHLGFHVRRDPPAHDAAAVCVGDETHTGDTRPGGHMGQISDPQPVRRIRGEVTVDKVAGSCRRGSPTGASAEQRGRVRCRARRVERRSVACATRTPNSWPATTPTTAASAQRRAAPAPTAGDASRSSTWKGPPATQRRRARPRTLDGCGR